MEKTKNKYAYIGKNIKRIRVHYNLKQTELAKKIEKSTQYLNAVENGHKKPSLDLIISIADKLNIDPAKIMIRDEEARRQIKKIFEDHDLSKKVEELSDILKAVTKSA